MKKTLLSIIAFIGAFSLLISILVFPNLVINERQNSWVKTLDIVQEVSYEIDDTFSSSDYFLKSFYMSDTYKFSVSFPNVEDLEVILGRSLENGDRFSTTLEIPLVVTLNEIYYGGFFSSPWATERLNNFFYANILCDVEILNGNAIYSDIYFYDYSSEFNSSNILKLFTWLVTAQDEAKELAPELQLPTYDADESGDNVVYEGFVYIGDIFDYVINYIKFIYAYIQIPLKIYFIG